MTRDVSALERARAAYQPRLPDILRRGIAGLAVEEFIARKRNEKILKALNKAYEDAPDETELEVARDMKRRQRKLLEGETW